MSAVGVVGVVVVVDDEKCMAVVVGSLTVIQTSPCAESAASRTCTQACAQRNQTTPGSDHGEARAEALGVWVRAVVHT